MDILPVKTYYNNKEKIMKVFYRVKDCHELLVTEVPFEPYCYAEIKPENLSSVKRKYRMIGSEIENFAKVKLSYDEAKKIIESKETKLAEADLKPETRFIIDNYGNEEWTKDILPRIFYIDTEFEVNNGMLPSWQEIDNTFNAITIFDTYTDKFYSWFVIPSSKYNHETLPSQIHQRFIDDNIFVSDKEIEMYFFNSEKQLVNHLFDWFIAHTPDIITAWNSPFDIPCLMRRIYNHKGMKGIKQISPFEKVSSKILFSIENDVDVPFDQIIPGISVIDYLELYKKNTQVGKQSYALDAIAEEEIKQRKVKYKGNLDQLYREDFVLFCCYNIFDVDLIKKIDDKRKLLTITIDIRNLSKCEYEDILKMSHVIDNLFLLEARNRRANGENIVLPNKNYKDKDKDTNIDEDFDDYLGSILNLINNKNNSIFKNAVLKINETTRKIKERYLNEDDEQENDQFCGAYVKEPIPGRYAKLSDVDFASLYPSIMINFNLSPETYVGMVLNYDYLNELRVKKTFNDNSFNFLPESDNITLPITSNRDFIYVRLKNNEEITFNNIKEIRRWCKQNNYNIVGNGAIFDQKIENAIMPHIVKKLLEDRAMYKKKKIEAKQAGNDTLAAGYDTIQNALKIAANSCFTDDHYVVTTSGIKNIKDINVDDILWSFNKNTRQMEKDIVVEKIEKDYNGYIYNIKTGKNSVNFKVTEDHIFILENKTTKELEEFTAKEIFDMKKKRLEYQFPFMNEADDYLQQKKDVSILNFIIKNKEKYIPEIDLNIYIIPKKKYKDLRTFKVEHLFDSDKLIATTSKVLSQERIYRINLTDLTDNELNCLIKNRYDNYDLFIKDMSNHRNMPVPCFINMEDFSKLLGWIISEGGFYISTQKKYENGNIRYPSYSIKIFQDKKINQQYTKEIDELIKKIFNRNLSEYYNDSKGSFAIRGKIFYYFIADMLNFNLIQKNRIIPDCMLNASSYNKKLFLETLYKGDGDKSGNLWKGKRYTSNSIILMQQLISIWSSLGYNTKLVKEKEYYRLFNYLSNTKLESDPFITREMYKGKVYCCKMKNTGTLMAGRKVDEKFNFALTHNCYGSISLSIFRLFSLPIAEGITTTGQMIIKSSGYMLNNYINSLSDIKKDYIVYTDTDSLIFTCDTLFPDIKEYTKENIDKILVFTKSCQDFVNESIAEISNEMFFRYVNKPSVLKVKTEYFAKSAIYTSKKHYSMLKVYEDGIYEESLFNVGISLKRSSYNTKTKEFVELILRKILNFDDKNINDIILNEVNNIRKVYTLEDLGIPCGIKRLDLYTTTPINVRAAKIFNKYISRKNIDNISSGKLRYIYVKAWNNKIDLNRQIDKFNVVAWFPETKYIDIIAKEITIDHDKMIDRMIINTIKPFFEAMNWKIPDKELKSKANKSFCKFMRKG